MKPYHTTAAQVAGSFETVAYGLAVGLASTLIAGRQARAERDAADADEWRDVAARVRAGRIEAARARQADAARVEAARQADNEQRMRILLLRARAAAA